MSTTPDTTAACRILDANCNRLREALRCVEEYVRFGSEDGETALVLKTARHDLQAILTDLGEDRLLAARNTATDPFAVEVLTVERERADMRTLVAANVRRAQEASQNCFLAASPLRRPNIFDS